MATRVTFSDTVSTSASVVLTRGVLLTFPQHKCPLSAMPTYLYAESAAPVLLTTPEVTS